ncbi:OR4 protein, partial [Acromyrmex charruanus]
MAEDWNDCTGNNINMREMACKAKLLKVEVSVNINTKRAYKMFLMKCSSMQFVHLILCSCGTTLHVGSQINILLCWLSKLGSKDIKNKHDSFVTITTKIIRKHQKIINFSENVENLYTYIALLQFTSNIVMICSLAFLIVTAIGSPDATEQIVRSLLFYAVTNLEAFIFCFAGEYLNNKSKAIGNAAYNYSAWYDMKAKDSRVLLFIILRSQRQLNLTAGKMTVLSFECFTNAIGSPDATEHIVRSLLFYTVTNLEAFIFCYAGEYMKNKSKAVGNAAYNSVWYEMKPKNSRILIFVMLRAQKQLTLTVGKIMDLSLESFTSRNREPISFISLKKCLSYEQTLIIYRKFFEILTIMAEDWNDCASSNINMGETACKAKLADRITNAMFTLHTLTIVAYSIGVLLADVDISEQSELPLLLKVELPVNINTKRMYKMLLTMQFVHLIMSGCGTGLLNALLLTLTLHVGGQMDILRCWLSELVPRKNERSEAVTVTTNRIIRKHQRIINFSEYIEDLYTYIALVQFTSNTVLICSLGFLIAIGSPDATEHIVRSLLFYTVTNLEAFIFCYAGEYIKNKSKAIGNAAYNSAWYEMKPKNSRNLIFVILRAQKQLTLTVGKIMDLSLESFTSILHTAGQIEIMRHWLMQLVPRRNEDKHKSVAATTSKIIQKHQKIISFSRNIEVLYSYIALLQFVSNTIMICSIGFVIVTAIGSPNAVEQIMKSVLFYTITNLEAFIFCYAGEYLNNKSKEIGVAAYNCEWYDLKSTESRILLFIILRSQKQLTLTVGKMMDLSLQAFTSIMNASGSYLSMLLAMQ